MKNIVNARTCESCSATTALSLWLSSSHVKGKVLRKKRKMKHLSKKKKVNEKENKERAIRWGHGDVKCFLGTSFYGNAVTLQI